MRGEFSEFSYGFAVVYEFVSGHPGAIAAPEFPSLRAEGETGYDVRIPSSGFPWFLQFKLSEYMVEGRAAFRGAFGGPYYRFPIYSRLRSHQHGLLLNRETRYPDVYYFAPALHTVADLDRHFADRQVAAESSFIEPHRIGPFHDDNEHQVAPSTGIGLASTARPCANLWEGP